MQIEYECTTRVENVEFGQVFVYCDIPYIKTDKRGNAVNLRNGVEREFDESLLVARVNAKVVIEME